MKNYPNCGYENRTHTKTVKVFCAAITPIRFMSAERYYMHRRIFVAIQSHLQ